MRKALISISVAINALLGIALIAGYVGGGVALAKIFIKPAHERWVSQFELLPIGTQDVVFLGDSITEGGSWHELFPDWSVRNRGIGGDTSEGVLARLDQVTRGKPAKVFLLIGTNDLAMGLPEDEIIGNITAIVDGIRHASPGTQIFVQSVLPRGDDYREDVESANFGIQHAIQDKAKWLDLYPLMLNESDGSIRDDLSNDELHLLGEGYAIWRDAILTSLVSS